MSHPYIPLYVDDYEAATTHLTAEEDGIYSRLLRLCWRTPGCSLPNDPAWIARRIRVTADDFERVVKTILADFFTLSRGRYVQRRLKREYDTISRKKAARVNAGKMGGTAKALKTKETAPSNATVLPTDTRAFPEPEPEPEKKEEDKSSLSPKATKAPYPEDFEAAWSLYPHHARRSSKPDSLAQWRKLPHDARLNLPAACARYRRLGAEPNRDCGAPAMDRWLKRGLHLNWIEDAEPQADTGPVDPAVQARRLRQFRDTGAWDAAWGDKPANDTNREEAA
jgi:uncharacterized protein YdaU (DUF1376 family)